MHITKNNTITKAEAYEFFSNIMIPLWHDGTAEQIESDLKTSRGFNNGTDDHINNCSICQRKLAGLDQLHRR